MEVAGGSWEAVIGLEAGAGGDVYAGVGGAEVEEEEDERSNGDGSEGDLVQEDLDMPIHFTVLIFQIDETDRAVEKLVVLVCSGKETTSFRSGNHLANNDVVLFIVILESGSGLNIIKIF